MSAWHVAQVSEPTNSACPAGVAAGAVEVADALWALAAGGGAANAVAHDKPPQSKNVPAQSKTNRNDRSPGCSSGTALLKRRVSGRSVCMKKCMKNTAFEELRVHDQFEPQPTFPADCCAFSPGNGGHICILLLTCRCRARPHARKIT